MATYTTNLNLEKPATSENFNLAKINSNWDKIDAAYSTVLYIPSGSNARNYSHAMGYVSSGTQSITLAFPLGTASIKSGNTATVTSLKGVIRGISGYVDIFTDANRENEIVGTSGYTISTARRNGGSLLEVTIRKTNSTLTNVTNNTPVEGYFTTFTFTVA